MIDHQPSTEIIIDYTNHRGERALRRISPLGGMQFTKTEWHPEYQWFLYARDIERDKLRLFAMKDIHKWVPAS